jgi:CelD/BcsL family acetyltransferase involved in cellulose biosynthesis
MRPDIDVDLSFAIEDCPAHVHVAGPSPVMLPLRVGARTVFTLQRQLVRAAMPLERRTSLPDLPALSNDAHGFFVTGIRADLQRRLEARHPGMKPFVRQRYHRHFASLQDSFEIYFARFSAKGRSTLKRKLRKLSERSGGQLDVRSYAAPDEMAEFHRNARAVSATTYQERLLGAGLPTGEGALARMRDLAAKDAVRAWLLFLDGQPISYLFAPADGDRLIYAYLGYDPAFAELSPGTVLQLEALRLLMEERRFRLFDFTEGDGQHKRQFATGSVECVDLLLLRPTPANLAIGHGLQAFDAVVERSKRALFALGLSKLARAARR